MIRKRYWREKTIKSNKLVNELLEKTIKILGREHDLVVENGEIRERQKEEVKR